MKRFSILALAALLIPTLGVYAATITGSDETAGQTITQLPGSAADYYFVRESAAAETHFSLTYIDPTQYSNYTQLNTPAGNATYTGITFEHLPQGQLTNLISFTLTGNDPTFNYSDFDVYVLYDNTSFGPGNYDGNSIDDQIALAVGADATSGGKAITVSDPSVKIENTGRYVMFNVQGLSSGDELTIAASDLNSGNNTAYIGAFSLESAPEPSTYALMAGGLALLGFARWNQRRLAVVRA